MHTHLYVPLGPQPPHDQPEGGWPPQIRARLAAEKIAERRNRAASSRDYVDGYVPGGCSDVRTSRRPRRG